MNESQEKYLVAMAKEWLTRTHLGRTQDEKNAYLDAIQDVLTAVYQDTGKGMYPANHMYDVLEQELDA